MSASLLALTAYVAVALMVTNVVLEAFQRAREELFAAQLPAYAEAAARGHFAPSCRGGRLGPSRDTDVDVLSDMTEIGAYGGAAGHAAFRNATGGLTTWTSRLDGDSGMLSITVVNGGTEEGLRQVLAVADERSAVGTYNAAAESFTWHLAPLGKRGDMALGKMLSDARHASPQCADAEGPVDEYVATP